MKNVLIPKDLLKKLEPVCDFEGEDLKPYFKVTNIILKDAPSIPEQKPVQNERNPIELRKPEMFSDPRAKGKAEGWNECANLVNNDQI